MASLSKHRGLADFFKVSIVNMLRTVNSIQTLALVLIVESLLIVTSSKPISHSSDTSRLGPIPFGDHPSKFERYRVD